MLVSRVVIIVYEATKWKGSRELFFQTLFFEALSQTLFGYICLDIQFLKHSTILTLNLFIAKNEGLCKE